LKFLMTREFMMRPTASLLPVCVAAALIASLGLSVRAEPTSPSPGASPLSVSDFVLHGLERPVRVRLVCLAGGKSGQVPFGDVRTRYLKALFTQLDSDSDGKLSPAEATRLPAPRLPGASAAAADVHVAFNFRVLDVDGDGSATPAELDSYLTEFGEPPLRFHTVAGESGVDSLFRALDADGDQVLTSAEAAQFERLLQRDRDANRVLTLDELRGRVGQQLPPEFVAVGTDGVPKGPLRIVSDASSRNAADVEIRIEFAEDASSQLAPPKLTMTLSDAAKSLGLSAEKSTGGEPILRSGRRRLVVRVLSPVANSWTADRAALEQEFAGLAESSEGRVSLNSTMTPAMKAMLRLADRNGDERVDAVEFEGCLARVGEAQAAVGATRLRAVAFSEQTGLLPWADRNRDGRLSRRELAMIPELFRSFAAEEEGKEGRRLKAADLPMTTLLVLERGPFGDAAEKDVLRNAGPVWFSRADRNGDGDLDRDEFLGTQEDFDRLDGNRDGWIDLDEALRANTAEQNPKPGESK
jgi:hypothetical protein